MSAVRACSAAAPSRPDGPSSPPRRPSGRAAPLALLALSLSALWLPACAARQTTPAGPPPAAAGGAAPGDVLAPAPSTAVAALRRELDEIFGAPPLAHALWAVSIQSVDTGEVLYRRLASTPVLPASTMKVVTLAVAAERLGWDARFETRMVSTAPVRDGVLEGDLVVVGNGDPTIGGPLDESGDAFAHFTRELRAAGIRRVGGRLVGRDAAAPTAPFGAGWAWDDVVYGYSAPIRGLVYRESTVQLRLRPGSGPGEPARVDTRPDGSRLRVRNGVTTGAAGEPPDVELRRFPGEALIELTGSVPAGSDEMILTAAVAEPTTFFLSALRDALAAQGIEVSGEVADASVLSEGERAAIGATDAHPNARTLATWQSPPLTETGTRLMKVSQNLIAESIFRALAGSGDGSATRRARETVEATLTAWGVPPGQYVIADGSGLSRYNFLTADLLVRVLRRMSLDPRHDASFAATLPVAGRDGSLRDRLRGTRAENNARAKTGTLTGVRAVSGYVTSRDGERFAFAIIANNFIGPSAVADAVADLVIERLAHFSQASGWH